MLSNQRLLMRHTFAYWAVKYSSSAAVLQGKRMDSCSCFMERVDLLDNAPSTSMFYQPLSKKSNSGNCWLLSQLLFDWAKHTVYNRREHTPVHYHLNVKQLKIVSPQSMSTFCMSAFFLMTDSILLSMKETTAEHISEHSRNVCSTAILHAEEDGVCHHN